MSVRTALRRTPWITFGLLLATLWILYSWVQLFGALDLSNAAYVGQGVVGGVVGLLVMAAALGFLLVLFSELPESDPGPEPWPPRE